MIKRKNLLILLGILVVLAASAVWVFMMPSADEDAALQSTATAAPTIPVFQCDVEQISEMAVAIPDEQYTFIRQDGWGVKDAPDILLRSSAVDSLAEQLADLSAKSMLEQPEALDAYGLAAPQATFAVTLADGSQKTFLLGNEDPVNSIYYLKTEDAPTVYTITSSIGQSLLRGLEEYRDSTLLTVNTDALNRIVIARPDETIELSLTGQTEESSGEWRMIRPQELKTDSQRISEEVLTPITELSISDFVYDKTDQDAAYGLATPSATLTLYDSEGASQTLYVGAQSGTDYYLRTDRSVSIYLVPGDALSVARVEAFTLVDRFIHLVSIETVDQIDVATDTASYTLQLERTPAAEGEGQGEGEAEAEAEENIIYRLNGTEVTEDAFKDLYQQVIGLTADGFSGHPARGQSYVTITFHMSDGTVQAYSYGPYDERNYAAYDQNGASTFFVRQKKVEDMLTALQTAASGQDSAQEAE